MKNKEFTDTVDNAIKRFHGNLTELESAIGMLAIGRHYGWKVLYLIHIKSTIRKYEEILGVNIRECLPETADLTERSYAWKGVSKIGNFWKAVKGEIKGIRSPETTKSPTLKKK